MISHQSTPPLLGYYVSSTVILKGWCCCSLVLSIQAFTASSLNLQQRRHHHHHYPVLITNRQERSSSRTTGAGLVLNMAKYLPPTQDDASSFKASPSTSSSANQEEEEQQQKKKKSLHPKVGDFVRYYDLDGGKADGQVLIGKISFIQKNIKQGNNKQQPNSSSSSSSSSSSGSSGWTVELTEMESIGNGCYIDFGSNKRMFKKALRDLRHVSPVTANFVRTENAYKVPMSSTTPGMPTVRAEQYDIDDYEGPFSDPDYYNSIDQSIVARDGEVYNDLKSKLFRYSAIAGLAGTIIANLVQGTEDGVIYFAGFCASLVYLLLLTVKTDTMAGNSNGDSKFGKSIANLRFATPLLVLVGVTLYNWSRGDDNPVLIGQSGGGQGILFETVTAEQFAAAIIGFLTYRLPLFFIQIQEAFQDNDKDSEKESKGGLRLPGSAGIALEALTGGGSDKTAATSTTTATASSFSGLLDAKQLIPTVFLVSGPQYTGRPALVQRFIEEGEGKFIEPRKVDRVQDGAVFERLEQRGELISMDSTDRFGLTRKNVRDAALQATTATASASASESTDGSSSPSSPRVAVINADVELAKKIAQISGIRIVGVWVGLNSVKEFEDRLGQEIDSGKLVIAEGETRETLIRSKIRDIVKEIEYGISSGIFEFTILNENDAKSLAQLREAASYCFK